MAETVELYLKEFPLFLARYGNVKIEPNGNGHDVTAGPVKAHYEMFRSKEIWMGPDGKLSEREGALFLICVVTLPDYNRGEPISLGAAYRNGKFRRHDTYKDIPFP